MNSRSKHPMRIRSLRTSRDELEHSITLSLIRRGKMISSVRVCGDRLFVSWLSGAMKTEVIRTDSLEGRKLLAMGVTWKIMHPAGPITRP